MGCSLFNQSINQSIKTIIYLFIYLFVCLLSLSMKHLKLYGGPKSLQCLLQNNTKF